MNASHNNYISEHPELREILNDFLSAVLLNKPDDVYLFAKEYFHPFNPTPVKDKALILCGPFGVGKKTIINYLWEKYGDLFEFVRSYTTRPWKPDDEEGHHYMFISEEDFQKWKNNKEFLETIEWWDYSYATPSAEIDRIRSENKIPLIEVDFRGANSLRGVPANFLFVYPPSIKVLRTRLANRSDITEEQFKERIAEAIKEIEYANNAVLFTNRIVNDGLDKTKLQMDTLVQALYFQELKERREEKE